ncbi:ROK family protein [Chengkuizengella sediminis]|uniref:ROK family protein n=1 Tax=Chengkuizengella sediminis TaxID=1885917 RepID=UPI00138A64C8|nr:ROK family protein [Chengkuizengella sediminis]NDI35938.1 ROK family protein [Chengkuizengella sediminis]
MIFGGIEAGGTKFVCGIGNEKGEITNRVSIPTTNPTETMAQVKHFFRGTQLDAIGVGSFGPIDLNRNSETYGYIKNTPKMEWKDFDFAGAISSIWNVPIGFDTDVNAAALAESMWGAAEGLPSCLYITIGTGIGAGVIVQGSMLSGISHPEMGHVRVRRHPEDHYEGCCPYHHDCLEGLAAGPALEERWGKKGVALKDVDQVWELEAYYLSEALVNFILTLSPMKIVLGGGVMKQHQLFPLIQKMVQDKLNGYLSFNELSQENIAQYIVPPGLADDAGLKGAIALAKRACQSKL